MGCKCLCTAHGAFRAFLHVQRNNDVVFSCSMASKEGGLCDEAFKVASECCDPEKYVPETDSLALATQDDPIGGSPP